MSLRALRASIRAPSGQGDGTLFGVGEDAAIVAQSIARNRSEPAATD